MYSLTENIFDNELDTYYREFTKEETLEYINKLRQNNDIKNKKYLNALFDALNRGVQTDKVFFAECTANELVGKLQNMASSVLLPFSGIRAISSFINKLYYNLSKNTSSDALSIGGVYMPKKDQLFVFIKSSKLNNYKIHSNMLLYTLLHEMCHACAKTKSESFKNIFWSTYILPFYKKFLNALNEIYELHIPDNTLNQYAEIYATYLLDMETTRSTKILTTMYDTLYKINEKMTYLLYTFVFKLFSKDEYDPKTGAYLSSMFYTCYKDIGVELPKVFKLYQEFLFPSEIVSISGFVNNLKPEYIKMLNIIFT